jgi:ABC-type proline/glycine betaine transport system permease subunit
LGDRLYISGKASENEGKGKEDAVMMYASIAIFLIMFLLNLLFKIASFFRLGIPLLYTLAVPILFPDWVQTHETLATIFFAGLIALVVLSWVVTIRKRLLRKRQNRVSL